MFYINNIVYTDLLIFCILINLIMYIFLRRKLSIGSHSTSLLRWFILSVIFVAFWEVIAWFVAVPNNEGFIKIHYISNAFFLTFNILPVAFGLRYLDYKIFVSKSINLKAFLFFLSPVYLNIIFMIINLFSDGFLFSIDASNVYHRGIATYIGNLFAFFVTGIAIVYFFRNKKMITGRITQAILALTLLPVLGAILQMIFYGLSLGIPAYTLSLFIAFFILERDEQLKDPLTNLSSRVLMDKRLQFKLRAEEPFTVIITDVNDFKKINDIYGHAIGDKVLKDVSKILISNSRREDFVCRYGGDEFFVIIETTADIGKTYIKRVEENLVEYSANLPYNVSLSFGSLYVEDCSKYNLEDLIQITDSLMYIDKTERKEKL